MINWSNLTAIYLHRDPVDFRKSINGLSVIVNEAMGLSPFDPGLFVFCNRQRDKLKVLYWDNTGFALWYKRLEEGTFELPGGKASEMELSPAQLALILEGISLATVKHRKRYKRS